MNKKITSLLAITALLASAVATRAITFSFNFDSVASGSLASSFNASGLSFHNGKLAPVLDSSGDLIAGSEYWQIDAESDSAYPLTVEDPNLYGRGDAPSPGNALQALFQEVFISFDQAFDLSSFEVTLDNDSFGFASSIFFLSGKNIIGTLPVDQSLPGLIASQGALSGIDGIVLPAGAFYDNLRISSVPDSMSTGLALGLAMIAGLTFRRRYCQTV